MSLYFYFFSLKNQNQAQTKSELQTFKKKELIGEQGADTLSRSHGEGDKSEREASIRGAAGVDLRRQEKAICTDGNTELFLSRTLQLNQGLVCGF